MSDWLPYEISVRGLLAYVDPGAGSMVFQLLVASLVSSGMLLLGATTKLRGFFAKFKRERRKDPEAETPTRRKAA